MILRSYVPDEDIKLLLLWDHVGEMFDTPPIPNENKRIYIGEIGYPFKPIAWGQIKFEDFSYILSWYVSPEYRGLGHGRRLAKLLAQMAGRPIRAKINVARPRSERVAISLGMVPDVPLATGEKWWILK